MNQFYWFTVELACNDDPKGRKKTTTTTTATHEITPRPRQKKSEIIEEIEFLIQIAQFDIIKNKKS